jgi:formylglycine-generating enzyme required for sulfatase activity
MVAKPKPHVFLSHVREDAERIERLAAALEARGVATWIDRHQIKPGQRWQKAIEEAIRSGAFFVACFSQAYAARTRSYVNKELLIAIEEVQLRPEEASWFIPIRLDECEIPDRRIGPELSIRSFQWLDMFPDWAKSVSRLIEVIGTSPRPELLAPLSVFRDIDAPWCPELVVIPPGTFIMGSTRAQRRWTIGLGMRGVFLEMPQHRVNIEAPFAVGRYPVTFDEYDHFATATPRPSRSGATIFRAQLNDEGSGRGRQPAINVSWDDGQDYVAWLSQETGKPYRLLSEAEWEYACRAGTTTLFSWGDDITNADANCYAIVGKTTEVGSYPPNPWGVYDMHGNVWEWVEDCLNQSYTGAPTDGRAWIRGDCGNRGVRGGSWRDNPAYLRSAYRGFRDPANRINTMGFRVARALSRDADP